MSDVVSIVIPLHNAGDYIARAIESCLTQTYKQIEVIVADDGSTDHSAEAALRFGDAITFLPSKGFAEGACAARNRGLARSRGAYILFFDADDVLLPNKLELQLPLLETNQADCVLSQGMLVDENERPLEQGEPFPFFPDQDPFVYTLRYSYQTSLPLYRREIVTAVGGFRVGLKRAQDRDFQLRVAAAGARFAMVNERTVKLRRHVGQTMSNRAWPVAASLRLEMCIASEMALTAQLTPHRAAALAESIYHLSTYAFRQGDRNLARLGFEQARYLSPQHRYESRGWMRNLQRFMTPHRTYSLLEGARRLRSR